MLAHDPFLGQLGSFRCRGLGMSHRIPLGIGGITGFRAASAVARLNCHFWQEYCHFWQEDYLFWQDYCHFANIFCLFWRFAQKNFGFHSESQGIEDIRGFQRVSQGFERRVGLPPFVGGLRLRGFGSLESRVCRLEHLLGSARHELRVLLGVPGVLSSYCRKPTFSTSPPTNSTSGTRFLPCARDGTRNSYSTPQLRVLEKVLYKTCA